MSLKKAIGDILAWRLGLWEATYQDHVLLTGDEVEAERLADATRDVPWPSSLRYQFFLAIINDHEPMSTPADQSAPESNPVPFQTIREQWEVFRHTTIPDASDVQRIEMRKAYYGGFASCLFSLLTIMDPSTDEPTEEDLARLDQLLHEVNDFFGTDGAVQERP